MTTRPVSVRDAVRDELGDQMLRADLGLFEERFAVALARLGAASGHRAGDRRGRELGDPAPRDRPVARGPVGGRVQRRLLRRRLGAHDAARPSRPRRAREETRTIVRVRSGSPGKSAGPGLRADLTIEALADHDGVAPVRYIGLWPDAGVCLAVDGTMSDLRSGARDLVRTAVAQRRSGVPLAA
jgi:hypothetical protein